MSASPRTRLPHLFVPMLLLGLLLLTTTTVVSAQGSIDADDATSDPLLPPVLPMLLPSNASATEVAVHVAERFLPFQSRTTVGPYSPPAPDDEDDEEDDDRCAFRVMFSFTAYTFSPANAATMDCVLIDDDGRTWHKAIPDGSNGDGHGFCARRDVADDSSAYGVAVFRKSGDGPSLVHSARDSTTNVIAEAVLRGWTDPPVVVFRVQRLQRWQRLPSLTFVANISAISLVTPVSNAIMAQYCPSDPLGRVTRVIDGGNYYHDRKGMGITAFCVSYVQRTLHDLNGVDQFLSHVRTVELSDWRLNVCPWFYEEVMDVVTHTNVLVHDADNEPLLLCYKQDALTDDDDVTDLTDTDDLLKRLTVNTSEPDMNKRLVLEHHDEDAWAFTRQDDDVVAINTF